MNRDAIVAVADSFFEALRSGAQHIRLTTDACFESPMSARKVEGKEEVLAFIDNVRKLVSRIQVHQRIVEGDRINCQWEFETANPTTIIQASVTMRVEGDAIAEIRAYHDPRPFLNAQAIAMMNRGLA